MRSEACGKWNGPVGTSRGELSAASEVASFEGGYIEYPPLMTLPDPILAADWVSHRTYAGAFLADAFFSHYYLVFFIASLYVSVIYV
jgi:hypothetical protein